MQALKTALQIGICGLALTGLMYGAASKATNLAELPLKTSVLVKPNVIFGMDDSGSMDFEVLMYNNDGALWWDYTNGNGWGVDGNHPTAALRSLTSTWFNNVGSANNQWRKMAYLFPDDSTTGNRAYGDASFDHFAIPPTRQMAFTRWSGVYYSSAKASYQPASNDPTVSRFHNPLYYNPMVTYSPWAPAQLSSGPITPTDASVTATRSHPVLGGASFDLTQPIPATRANDQVFTAAPGMMIPAGAQKSVCDANYNNCGAWTNVLVDEVALAGKMTQVAMAYYAPTFWVKESCTPQNISQVNDTCTTIPDGSTLKRYEIKPGNTFPSGRTYADELQNFANWFQYFRKRKLMLAAAMGDTMEYLTGMRLGVVAFNSRSTVTMYDADATSAANNRLRVAGIFYEVNRSGGTPTRETLKYIGDQYARTDQSSGKYNVIQYACQRNNAFIVTDGFANDSSVTPPGYDTGKSKSTWTNGNAAPYGWDFSHDGVLADLALRYYTNNPRSDLALGVVPGTPNDTNANLHMNTYGLVLGSRGTIFMDENTAAPTSTSIWPDPNTDRNPTSVDDLWHATINGRGKMYLATTPEQTSLQIQTGLNDILNQVGAQSGVAVSAVNLDRSDGKAYLGFYNQRGWVGDIEARPIDKTTAAISTTTLTWSANTQLNTNSWSTRKIFTSNASGGLDFNATTVGSTVNPDNTVYTNAQVINYLRGDRSNEGKLLRTRSGLLGPIVNAEPVLSRDEQIVYVASGDGLLHAFDTVTGNEQWAYAPPDSLANIGLSVQRGWVYSTLLDATPTVGKLSNGNKLLVGGLGAAGRSYYALDVTTPRNRTTAQAVAQYKWIFPTASDTTTRAKMGYTVGQPVFARTAVDGDVVLVTSGYDNGLTIGDGKGRLWMLKVSDGTVIKTFVTTAGTAGGAEAGLTHVAAFREQDGSVRYAYGGDLLGNVWRFDLTAAGAGEITAAKVAVLMDSSGNTQPVTSKPELAYVSGKRVLMVGTGRMLDISDFGNTSTQSFYAIVDGNTLTNARTGLVARTYTRGNNPQLSGGSVDFTSASARGWYFDLPAGEQVNTDPNVAYGVVAFATNKSSGTDCGQASWLYYVDVSSGAQPAGMTNTSLSLSSTATSSRPVVVRTSTGQLQAIVQLSNHGVVPVALPPSLVINPAKNAWREIRR